MADLRATTTTHAAGEVVYDLISDVTRMGEWSPENQGGEWLDGATGARIGARFRSRNKRRASWTTTAVVTEAHRAAAFGFAVGKRAPDRPDTRWRFTIADLPGGGCAVTETCEIARPPGWLGRRLLTLATGVAWADRPGDLVHGMEETLRRLAAAAEAIAGPR